MQDKGTGDPVAEGAVIVAIGARERLDALLASANVPALFAPAGEVVQETTNAEPNFDPPAIFPLEHQHTSRLPHLDFGKAWRIFTELVVAGSLEDFWPVELSRYSMPHPPWTIFTTWDWTSSWYRAYACLSQFDTYLSSFKLSCDLIFFCLVSSEVWSRADDIQRSNCRKSDRFYGGNCQTVNVLCNLQVW